VVAALLISFSAFSKNDPRIYNFVYDKNKVYPVYTMLGAAILLQLEEDERLNITDTGALGMGDSKAWKLGVQGNGILMKPQASFPNTNLIIVTNKRTYVFEILTVANGHSPTYVVRFMYPDTEAKQKEERRLQAIKTAKEARENDLQRANIYSKAKLIFNPNYSWIGSSSKQSSKSVTLLKPSAAWDDGRFTHLQYDNAASMPNFYKVLPDGTEALINSNIDPQEKNTVILQEVVRMIRVRLGEEVIEVINNAFVVPAFNKSGTGGFDSLRVLKK
jgi:type IV secretion system protein VirB9